MNIEKSTGYAFLFQLTELKLKVQRKCLEPFIVLKNNLRSAAIYISVEIEKVVSNLNLVKFADISHHI